MAAATAKIVVHLSPRAKRAIEAQARKLGPSASEPIGRAALSCTDANELEALEALADGITAMASRAGAKIEEALRFVEASNARMAAADARAAGRSGSAAA